MRPKFLNSQERPRSQERPSSRERPRSRKPPKSPELPKSPEHLRIRVSQKRQKPPKSQKLRRIQTIPNRLRKRMSRKKVKSLQSRKKRHANQELRNSPMSEWLMPTPCLYRIWRGAPRNLPWEDTSSPTETLKWSRFWKTNMANPEDWDTWSSKINVLLS